MVPVIVPDQVYTLVVIQALGILCDNCDPHGSGWGFRVYSHSLFHLNSDNSIYFAVVVISPPFVGCRLPCSVLSFASYLTFLVVGGTQEYLFESPSL
jgi:hypothetical protein